MTLYEDYVVSRQLTVRKERPPHGQVPMVDRAYSGGLMPSVYAEVKFEPVALKDTGYRKVVRI